LQRGSSAAKPGKGQELQQLDDGNVSTRAGLWLNKILF
jgi:hypothetical protein